MVIVVITLSKGEKCEDEIIDRCQLSDISPGAPGMSQRIDEKHRMMEDKHPCEETEIEARKPVRKHSYREYYYEIQIEGYKPIIVVLEANPFTRPEIGDFGGIHGRALEEKPSHMSIPESFFDTIWILVGVSFCMMNTMIVGPGRGGASKSETSEQEIENFDDWMCLVGPVCEKSVIPRRDTETSKDIETYTTYKRHPAKRARKKIKRRQNNQ